MCQANAIDLIKNSDLWKTRGAWKVLEANDFGRQASGDHVWISDNSQNITCFLKWLTLKILLCNYNYQLKSAKNSFALSYRSVLMSTTRIRCFYAVGIMILLVLTGQSGLSAITSPMEALKIPIETVLSLLKDPKYKDPDQRQQQRDKIFAITRKLFDYTEMSKRTLARNWKSFSPQEQLQFVDVFADHLSNSYMDKIQGEYKGETIVFLGQEMVADGKAMVTTKIQRQPSDISVDYSMLLVDNQWRVYDVNIEGVSLIKNYRTQFDQILVKESPAQLIERLKKKVELKIGN